MRYEASNCILAVVAHSRSVPEKRHRYRTHDVLAMLEADENMLRQSIRTDMISWRRDEYMLQIRKSPFRSHMWLLSITRTWVVWTVWTRTSQMGYIFSIS